MAKEKYTVDDIFQEKIGDYIPSEPIGTETWDNISVQLDKKRFYRFSLSRFNIYYAVAIITCTTSTLYSLTERFFLRSATGITKRIVVVDTLYSHGKSSHESIVPSEEERSFSATRKSPYTPLDQHHSLLSKDNRFSVQEDSNVRESLSKAPLEQTFKEDKTKEQQVEVLYVYKRDTIFKYDTVSVKQKKKR